MRGRGTEFETVLALLDGTQQGQGRVLLVEGEPGTGKSLLLARAGEEAGRRGFRVVAASAGELSPAPSLDGLDELVSAGPVLVTVDNVQWADLATRQALRSMPRLLTSCPLSWILAVGTSSDAGPAELLFGLLESDGAARISLGPLDHEAQVALIGDVLGAVPDQTLIELAADAAGNPLVLAEAFGGLRDENAIVVRDGHASLAPARVSSARVTSRIETLARDRLRVLSAHARRFVAAASVLGGSFRLEDVGEILGESPGALLGALDEALSAYLLVVRADGLAFRHEFVRQAVARMLRQLGVRRRHWASEQRPAAGWASLTDIEQATARLVAEGLTNQRIAGQLFISTHTVAFHLRQMFRKLDIRSRVDLARIALKQARPEARKPHDWGM